MEQYRVMVIDDEPLIRSLLEKYFKTDPRFSVEAKEDCTFIMKGPLTEKYDLIVFDVLMPNVNGIEFLQNLKHYNPDIKTIAITGMANEGLLRKLTELGCHEILRKPIKRQEFMQAVYKVLGTTEKTA